MRIDDDQADAVSLTDVAAQATVLLVSQNYPALAEQFGYALAYDRAPASAIREDLLSSLAELQAYALVSLPSSPASVRYFAPNDCGLFAIVEQRISTENGEHVLLELAVTLRESEKHVAVEQISAAA